MKKNPRLLTLILIPFCLTGCGDVYSPSYSEPFSMSTTFMFKGKNVCDQIQEKLLYIDHLTNPTKVYDLHNLCTINIADQTVDVDEKLVSLIERANYWKEQSGGVYNPLASSLDDLWYSSIKNSTVPENSAIETELNKISLSSVSTSGNNVTLSGDATISLDLVAPGFGLQEIKNLFKENDIHEYSGHISNRFFITGDTKEDIVFFIGQEMKTISMKDACAAYTNINFYPHKVVDNTTRYGLINHKTGLDDHKQDAVIILGDSAVDAAFIARIAMFTETENLKNLETTYNVKIVSFINGKTSYKSRDIELK